jgi:hypothetical protein
MVACVSARGGTADDRRVLLPVVLGFPNGVATPALPLRGHRILEVAKSLLQSRFVGMHTGKEGRK